MKHIFCWIVGCVILISSGFGQTLAPSLDSIKSHVYYLASPQLKGRNTGSEGQKTAANFIAERFENYGLQPLQNTEYYHYYQLKRKGRNTISVQNYNNILISPWHFYFASGYNQLDTLNSTLIFAGYGSNEEVKNLTITDKAIAFISDDPADAYQTILRLSTAYGNKQFFVIFPKKNHDLDKVWSDEFQLSSLRLQQSFDRLQEQTISDEWANPTDSLNIYYCFPNVLRNVFLMNDEQLENVAKNNINQNYELLTAIIQPDISCMINFHDTVETILVENVGGYIKGKDTSRTIVVSAHYDHIGEDMGFINYGADDNASGTAALLECSRLMSIDANMGTLPETNVLFMAFSGEEMGLLGSEAFVTDSTTPLNEIYHNINMDMIGRWDELHEDNRDFVYLLTEGKNSKAFYKIGKNKVMLLDGFEIDNNPGGKEKMVFRSGSDHYSFYKKDIPVSIFFTGLHEDYHSPRDTPDKINYQNLTNITSVVYQYIYKISAE
jgi:hypothetical protein